MKRPLPWLAQSAAFERDSRAAAYPAAIAAGKIEKGEAEADLLAWQAMASLFAEGSVEVAAEIGEGGEFRRLSPGWAELEHAAAKALIHLSARAADHPGDRARAERRDAVQSIHDRIVHSRWFWTAGPGIPPPTGATIEREAA